MSIEVSKKSVASQLPTKWKQIETNGSQNLGVFEDGDIVIKLVKPNKLLRQETFKHLTRIIEEIGLQRRVIIPTKISLQNYNGKPVGVILMPKASGIQGNKLSDELIEQIPKAVFEQFETDIRLLSQHGVLTDLTKRSNFFYTKLGGLTFIDIAEIVDKPTGKFFVENGVEKYYEFERFPVLPKIYTNSKDLFLSARRD